MGLTGINPNDPIPTTRRELILGAGPGSGASPDRTVLLVGNQLGGSATNDDVTDPVTDELHAIGLVGRRSELYAMYRKYVAVDPGATIRFGVVTESAGLNALAAFTFATNADADAIVETTIHGEIIQTTISSGDTPTVVALAVSNDITAADEGRLQVTASPAAGVVTVTAAQNGPRGDLIIGATATRGVRMRIITIGSTNAMTVSKGALTNGTVDDDATALLVNVAQREYYYQALPFHDVVAWTDTDNQGGEWMLNITQQALPINGKEQTVHAGLVGTQAQATLVGDGENSTRCFLYHAENNDWTPAMIAAHCCAVVRSQQIAHPSANIAGYTSTDNTIFSIPKPFVSTDLPTDTELRADLNNGVSPISFRESGTPFLVRHVTSRSSNAGGTDDYKAREGHITSAIDFAWGIIEGRWEAQKQPFVANDPVQGENPKARTTTPLIVKGMINQVIDDLTASKPLGLYEGPILAPDKADQMKKTLIVTKIPAGISVSAELFAVEHLLKGEFLIRETGPAY